MRKIAISVGEFYHLYNRGTEKRTIFLGPSDYSRFMNLLYLCNSEMNIVFRDIPIGRAYEYDRGEPLVEIISHCLMPNHFHLLVREKTEGGTAKFMLKLLTAYSMYFNKKNRRTGALFEGRFKAKHADTDEYLKYLMAYIHLNPVKLIDSTWKDDGIKDHAAAENFLATYEYSSYTDWKDGDRNESKILNKEALPEYFTTGVDFNKFVNDFLLFKEE